jgi:hypothetical protein
MAMNRIQFQQHGMSLPEFLRCFGTEANCAEAVIAARWPSGFACPKCGEQAHCVISVNFRPLFQCNGWHRQTSVTAGTLFVCVPRTTPCADDGAVLRRLRDDGGRHGGGRHGGGAGRGSMPVVRQQLGEVAVLQRG